MSECRLRDKLMNTCTDEELQRMNRRRDGIDDAGA